MIDTSTECRPERLAVEPVVVPASQRLRYIMQYHRTSQLAMRLVAMGRKRWRRWAGAGRWARPPAVPTLRENPPLVELLDGKLARRRERGSAEAARRVLAGRYRFLHHEVTLDDPVDWRLTEHPETPLLWRFHLHYHEFLLDLAAEAGEQPEYLERTRERMLGWIRKNPLGDAAALDDAWHPYCISRRLPVWVLLSSGFDGALAEPPILASLAAQARFLSGNLEWDLRGNHLLENLRALAMAGAVLDGPEADHWLDTAQNLFEGQLEEQILPHGEHFERSPMYHAMMLEALLDVRDATRAVRPALAERCGEAADRMAGFLGTLLHPDGEIPLLGDSCLGEAPSPETLLVRAKQTIGADGKGKEGNGPVSAGHPQDRSRPSGASSDGTAPQARLVGGYWTFRDGEDFVLLDAAPVGPDDLPAHAHSDLLTWEASLGGKRLVVDSGVFHYRDDAMRHYCRATEAHNVLQIDDRPLCDTWSSFRMGYRGRPGTPEMGRSGPYDWVRASHNAYRRLGVPRVARMLECRAGGPWICTDLAEGSGTHRLTNWLHLHPDAQVEIVDATWARVVFHGYIVQLRPLAPGELTRLEGWYCPAFGVREPNAVLRWTAVRPLPALCGWSLGWRAPLGRASKPEAARET